ncbi:MULTISPECIES: hypothetical protein [Flavobacterium]|nr:MULTISPECIES: hypothetical protein [Flavobacterium]UOK42597.1 hypothetical protein LZF87_00315 [Flavobacterium enshiense]
MTTIYNDNKLNVKFALEQIKEVIIFNVLGRILVKPTKVMANHLSQKP